MLFEARLATRYLLLGVGLNLPRGPCCPSA
jgi:hypothetical protein